MNREIITELICEALGCNTDDVSKDTMLEELISDEYELNELLESVGSELKASIEIEPAEGWTLEDLVNAISEAI